MNRSEIVGTAALLVATAACSSDGSPPSGATSDAGASPTLQSISALEDFCERAVKPLGDAFDACCTQESRARPAFAPARRTLTAAEDECATRLAASASRGRIAFDRDAASRCIGSVVAVIVAGNACWSKRPRNGAAPPVFTTPQCKDVVVGRQPEGAPCAGDHECQNGFFCAGGDGSTEGTCAVPAAVGSGCTTAPRDGVSWGFGDHPRCVLPREASARNGVCARDADCKEGLYCESATTESQGRCLPRRPAGQACAGAPLASECSGVCDQGTCARFCGSD